MTVKKICCLNAGLIAGVFSSVVALKCPQIEVYVVDQRSEKIRQWNSNKIPVYEPNLEELVKRCRDKNLFFTDDIIPIKTSDVIFICSEADSYEQYNENTRLEELNIIETLTRLIVNTVDTSKIIVEKSLIPVRAAELIYSILEPHKKTDRTFALISNPQFFTEGCAVNELLNPERVLIGGDKGFYTAGAIETVISLYERWVPRSKIITSDTWSTELSNLADGALLAQKILGINSLTEVCETLNADIKEVIDVIEKDSRVGSNDLEKCIGFRGANFLKNIQSIIYLCESLSLSEVTEYWQRAFDLSEHFKEQFVAKISAAFFYSLKDRYLAILGFSYKKETSCTYNSAAIYICKALLEENVKLKIHDPAVSEKAIIQDLTRALQNSPLEDKVASTVQIFSDPYDAMIDVQGIVLCTDWPEFLNLDYYKVFNTMLKPAHIFDAVRVLPHKELQEIGYHVHTFGKMLAPTQGYF